jgi:hypothetical protein
MIGFREEYDKLLSHSQYFCKTIDTEFSLLAQEEQDMVMQYLEKSDMILSKTLALFDGKNYIGPYMIFSDGEWIWPSYFLYNLTKRGHINSDFLSHVRQRNYSVMPLTKEQKREVTIFLEKKMLNI